MRSKGQTEKWITAGLGAVCLVLVVNFVFRGGQRSNTAKPATPAARPPAAPQARSAAARAADDLAQYDPAVRVDEFEKIQGRPEAKLNRNPFEFVVREMAPTPQQTATTAAPTPQAPPAPPPPPLKAIGYSEKGGGVKEAMVTFQDELFVVHEGETFAKRFRVTKLSPVQVEVSDETTQQTIRLPIGG
jgi:cell division protein FtsN